MTGWPTDWSAIPAGSTITPGDLINTGPIKKLKFGKGGITIKGPCRIEGYWFDFSGVHGLTFTDCHFKNCGQFRAEDSTWNYCLNCSFSDLAPGNEIMIQLGPGNDWWSFRGCKITRAGCGIYTRFGDGPSANHLRVWDCEFSDLGTAEHPHADAHAIGIQEGRGHLIDGCKTNNTGETISLWARASERMTDILIQNCTVRNVRAKSNTEGNGIVVSGSHDLAKDLPHKGWRAGIQIAHCDVRGCDGNGIRSNARDKVYIFGNTIGQCAREPIFLFNHFGKPDWSEVKNNKILK